MFGATSRSGSSSRVTSSCSSLERIDGAVWPATLRVPSEVHSIPRVVALAVRLIEGLLAPAATRDEAYALIAQARQVWRRRSYVDAPYALVERAHTLAPADPVVNANHAILLARAAFFAPNIDPMLIPRATEYVRVALATGGHLADAHIAAGHLELHTGESSVAAAHYRVAIACAPYSAEAHDHLGRMLLEAGYLDAGFARLAQATAISPLFVEAGQAVARAHALEGRWHEVTGFLHDERNRAREIIAARLARWRGDTAMMKQLRARYVPPVGLDPRIADLMMGNDRWSTHRDDLMALLDEHLPSRRRNAFVAQLVAEAAGDAGDIAGCTQALTSSAAQGLFDRHWLEKCPLLACARSTEAFAAVHAQVAARAHAIYDALYGDHRLGHGETVLATS
jgi:eukaryotic-like serine/threonine-protein kinase